MSPRAALRILGLAASLLLVVTTAAEAACRGVVDIGDVGTIAWAVVPSFSGARYTEVRRIGPGGVAPQTSAFRLTYAAYGVAPTVERSDLGSTTFAEAIALLESARVVQLEPSVGPPPIVRSDGTTESPVRLDGTNTYVTFERCGVTVQLQMHGRDDPRLSDLVTGLDALVAPLAWHAWNERAPLLPPVFRFPY